MQNATKRRSALVSGRDAISISYTPANSLFLFGIVLVVSAAAGGLAWAACYPFDAVKSVQQGVPLNGNEAKRTIRGAAAELWRRGGVRSFYGGLGASLARACMVTSSRLLAYEKVKAWCLAV